MTSVKVAVRVRPLNQRENDLQCKFIIRMEDNKTTITNLKLPETSAEGDQGRDLIRYRQFTYDFSFWTVQKTEPDYASQQQVFECLGRDVVTSAYDGYNACVFAYGQTGSGKTYTMMGNPGDLGLIPRICRDLFAKMVDEDTSYRAEVSYLEIYNEKVRDLLKPSPSNKPMHSLRVREHPKYGPYVQDLSKHLVNDYSDIENLMNRGNAIRTTAATNMNDTSSRSHAIFTIIFTQAKFNEDMPCETSSKIHLVDLAGSERADASGATGQRLKEGGSINKSLVTLGSVISVLADISEKENKGSRTPFIPYRDSVLTWLLKDSLGGNARTIMVATISPADVNYAETLSTLRYANRAKNIINRPTVNEDPNVKLIRELREEISRLKTLLGGNIDNISSPKVQEKLHENEARVKVLTQEWAGKWNETETILQNQPVALRKEGLGVVLDSALPHLIGIDDDILSTGIMLYHLKEGTTTVGRTDSEDTTDIVIAGIDVEENHCVIENHRGEVTLYPEQGALCAVNGVAVTDPVKLTQGAVILLGKTNMFRFNHPAEAAKMKEELKSCGLCLSRTSLLSQSMSDLYKSSENLSLLAAGFEAEQAHREDLEKLEDKRHQIDLLEKKHRKAEKERNKLQVTIETELEEKQERLDMLQKQIDEEINVSEKLKLLEERERHVTDMAETQTTRLEQESERIKSDYERQKSEVQTLTTQQTELEEKISAAEADVTSQVATLLTGKSQAEDIIERETENLEKLETMLESRRRQVILNSSDIREKLARLDDEEQEYIAQCEAEEVSMKTAWNPTLFDIEDKNQKIEEAWRDIQEHERGLKFKSQKISVMSEADKEKLENEKHELAMARTLLKEEEERVSRQQQEVLDKIEKEMDEWEKRKRGKLKEIEKQKNDVVILSDKDLIDLQQKIDSKIVLIEETKLGIQHRDSELHQLDKKLNETTSSLTHELDKVKTEKGNVMRVMSQEEEVCQALTEISNQIIQVDREYQLQMSDIRSEKQRLLQLKESIDNSCLDGEVLSEDEILQRKMKEVEDLKQQLDNAQQVFEEKQKKFEEERNAEMDRIEYEMLKLQEMERQERINALVEQEVKRRMFEEKLQRENRRKVEREQEQSERAEEIQKIKDQHNRELRQLKAKLDKINNGVPAKSLMPSKSNPYVTVMTPDAPKNEENVSNRQRTGSSPLSGSLILSTDVQALNILIPSYRRQGYGSDTHYEYEVKISIGSEAWTIFRRYSKFRQLHQEWRNRIPEVNSLVFPGKKLFSKSEKVVIERQNKLQTYLRNFISVCMRNTCCVLHPSNNKYITKQVLCRFDTFFKRGLFEASKHNAT